MAEVITEIDIETWDRVMPDDATILVVHEEGVAHPLDGGAIIYNPEEDLDNEEEMEIITRHITNRRFSLITAHTDELGG
jgi:hypothetical protein